MIGNIQVQKRAQDANTNFGFAQSGSFAQAGFVADPASQNLSGASDALQLVIPNSGIGTDALQSFSIVGTGTLSNAVGEWKFAICLDAASPEPAPPLGPQNLYATKPPQWAPPNWGSPQIARQPLPQTVASANISVNADSAFAFEADITVTSGVLSGLWTFVLAGSQVASGSLSNLPGNLARTIA
ncbi:MAG: hypothetical protein ACREBW_07365, partial [Candidatus Micrarchaeaceae archaeon]